jgi:glutamyl-tRNA reductase
MLNNFKVVTLTHKNFPLHNLGKFILEENTLEIQLNHLMKFFNFRGLFYSSTCNRILLLIDCDQTFTEPLISEFFLRLYPHLSQEDRILGRQGAQIYHKEEAIRHLFEVASSIDSMVVGEREIFRQLREAYEKCYQWNLISDQIRVAFQTMVRVAKNVYANTRIGEKSVSVVSLAISRLMSAHIPKNEKIVLIGAGQTHHLVCKFLKKNGFENVTIFNRTLSKAQALASKFANGKALPLTDLNSLEDFKVLFLTTSSKHHLLTEDQLERLQSREDRRYIIDLSVPANISPDLCNLFGIELIDIPALKNLANENMEFRRQEINKVREIIDNSLREFASLFHQRLIEKAFKGIPDEIKAVKKRATEEVFKNELEQLDESSKLLVIKMMDYMEKKCIGIPMKAAKSVVI